jgi:hypothetical protein
VSYERPVYEVTRRLDDAEIRRYEPYVVAETTVRGSLEDVGNRAFRRLAGYIFGGNRSAGGESTKIAMTAPVMQQQVGDEFRVRFMMPTDAGDVDTLPVPNDDRVRLAHVDEQFLAAIRYRGRWSRSGFERHLALLRDELDAHGVVACGEPIWARYDPPWTPWFRRHNEVLLPVDSAAAS